jgi:PhnB protein
MISESSVDYPPSRAALYLYVDDADASVAKAVDQGAIMKMDIADMPYGDRQGGIVDPSGNIWWISQRLTTEPYAPPPSG